MTPLHWFINLWGAHLADLPLMAVRERSFSFSSSEVTSTNTLPSPWNTIFGSRPIAVTICLWISKKSEFCILWSSSCFMVKY